jgi:hypothetical protein
MSTHQGGRRGDRITRAAAALLLEEQRKSGMSVAAFARERDIPAWKLYEASRRRPRQTTSVDLIEVQVAAEDDVPPQPRFARLGRVGDGGVPHAANEPVSTGIGSRRILLRRSESPWPASSVRLTNAAAPCAEGFDAAEPVWTIRIPESQVRNAAVSP